MSDNCDICGESTAFGSGKFVNRVSSDDGWRCGACSGFECDHCGDQIYVDCEVRMVQDEDGVRLWNMESGEDYTGNYHSECVTQAHFATEIDSSLAYVSEDGDYCPRCKGREIEIGSCEYDLGMYFHERTCLDCGLDWCDEYALVSYYNITDRKFGERLTDFLRATIRRLSHELATEKGNYLNIEHRLSVAEGVLERSDWSYVYNEEVSE